MEFLSFTVKKLLRMLKVNNSQTDRQTNRQTGQKQYANHSIGIVASHGI